MSPPPYSPVLYFTLIWVLKLHDGIKQVGTRRQKIISLYVTILGFPSISNKGTRVGEQRSYYVLLDSFSQAWIAELIITERGGTHWPKVFFFFFLSMPFQHSRPKVSTTIALELDLILGYKRKNLSAGA